MTAHPHPNEQGWIQRTHDLNPAHRRCFGASGAGRRPPPTAPTLLENATVERIEGDEYR